MVKIWFWIRNYYKWLIFPIWALSVILVWIFRGGAKTQISVSRISNENAEARDKALLEFRGRLDEIEKKASERLKSASKEQIEQFKELKGKSIEEISKWIDTIS